MNGRSMNAKHAMLLLIFAALVSLIMTCGGLLVNESLRYADFETDRFGFPYYWIEHVLATFAGRADHWHIEIVNFGEDIALYFMVSLALLSLVLVFKRRGTKQDQ